MNAKTVTLSLALFALPLSAAAGDYLKTSEEIRDAFSGMTLTWKHLHKDKAGKSYLTEDGRIIGVSNGEKRAGTWKVKGDSLCVSWGQCLGIEADGEGGYYKVKGDRRVVHIMKVEYGNNL